MKPDVKIAVLFVCMGNICRSPAGEAIFRHYVEAEGRAGQFLIDSAGTIATHAGRPADERMRRHAQKRGYRLDSPARLTQRADFDRFDRIVPMDRHNLRALWALAAQPGAPVVDTPIRLLGSFIEGYSGNHDAPEVPDPYYGGAAGFERVLDMIESACPALMAWCLAPAAKPA